MITLGIGPYIKLVNPGRMFNGEIPLCEARFEEREVAIRMREEFGQLRKEGKVTGRLCVSNSMTLGTRSGWRS